MKKLILIISLVLAVSVVFAGCGEDKKKEIETITREAETGEKVSEVKDNVQEEKKDTDESAETDDEKTEDDKETEDEKSPVEEKPSATLAAIREEIKKSVNADGAMDLDASAVSGLYGIDAADIKDAAGFVVMAGTFPHEVIMVDAPDEQAAMRVESLLKVKHTSFVEQSKGYDAENYALAQKCKVDRKGNRISMFLSPDYAVMNSIISKYK